MKYFYMALLSMFCGVSLSARDSQIYANKNITEFILCTSSGSSTIDYGIFSLQNNKSTLLYSSQINNKCVGTFTDMVCDILAQAKKEHNITISCACFAAPGVSSKQEDYLTHWRLPYAIDVKEITKKSGLIIACIVNDFLAMSYGIDLVDEKDIKPLHDVFPQLHGRRAIIGAGDGLGSVTMIWNECRNRYNSFPAEAGTGNFPAQNQFEFDLAESMKQMRNMSTVHWAFFLSVPGIYYTYKILKNMNKYSDSLDLNDSDGMTVLAYVHEDGLCKATADLFFKLYARFAYNFVWTTLPFGGLYLVGPTVTEYPEMLSEIFLPEFFNCVASKRDVLKRIPIYMIHAGADLTLHGAAQYFLSEKI